MNLPSYNFRIRTKGQNKEIFDSIRRKFVSLTPEEWVRQHFIMYMLSDLGYPKGFIAVERALTVNERIKRADIIVYNPAGNPWMIVECKSPDVLLNEDAFYQAAGYHLKLNVEYLIITNGLNHYCCKFADGKFHFIENFPTYNR